MAREPRHQEAHCCISATIASERISCATAVSPRDNSSQTWLHLSGAIFGRRANSKGPAIPFELLAGTFPARPVMAADTNQPLQRKRETARFPERPWSLS